MKQNARMSENTTRSKTVPIPLILIRILNYARKSSLEKAASKKIFKGRGFVLMCLLTKIHTPMYEIAQKLNVLLMIVIDLQCIVFLTE